MLTLDHIIYATNNLHSGIEDICALTGVTAEVGGSHAGKGTCNALLSFGNNRYLEIIAPDTQQNLSGTLGADLQQRESPGILAWAIALDSFTQVIPLLDRRGYRYSTAQGSRIQPSGSQLNWQMLFIRNHPFDNLMPFFINWLDSPHPANDTPGGCALEGFTLTTNNQDLRNFIKELGVDIEIAEGFDSMSARILSPNGEVVLR